MDNYKKVGIGLLLFSFLIILFPSLWIAYQTYYLILATGMIWVTLLTLFFALMKKEKVYPEPKEKFTVIMPVFNEKSEDLIRSILSIINSDGNKEIMLCDDGSTNGIFETIKLMQKKYPKIITKIHRFEENQSKRKAQEWMIRNSKTDIVVSVDSDLTFEKQSFIELIKPLSDPKTGISTGSVKILGENNSILNRIQALIWWCSDFIGRKSMGGFGIMPCACGTSMSFRKKNVMKFLDKYVTQTHCGKVCRFGEDRYLTNLFLTNGFDVVFVDKCVANSVPQPTWKKLILQQCLPPNEKIYVKINEIEKIMKIGELAEYMESEYGWKKTKNIQALSFNEETLKIEWKEITGILKQKKNGRLKEITLSNGRNIVTTCDHDFLVPTYDGFYRKRAGLLKIKDALPLISGNNNDNKYVKINIGENNEI